MRNNVSHDMTQFVLLSIVWRVSLGQVFRALCWAGAGAGAEAGAGSGVCIGTLLLATHLTTVQLGLAYSMLCGLDQEPGEI